MAINEIVSYLAEMPSGSDALLHTEDYFAEDRRQGEEYDNSRAEIKQDEGGFKAEVYLDTEGYPTIGIGHKLLSSEIDEYGARGRYPYTDAGKAAMRRDFTRKGKILTWPAEKGEAVFRVDYDAKYKDTRAAYSFRRGEVNGMSWDELPSDARYTLLNMGYNMGGAGLQDKFPGMLKATASGQWELAAHEIKYKDGAAFLRGEESALSDYYRQLQGHRVGEDLETARSFRQFGRMSNVTIKKEVPPQEWYRGTEVYDGLQRELRKSATGGEGQQQATY